MKTIKIFVTVMTLVLLNSAVFAAEFSYPDTERSDHSDDYHGTQVADPYRWLEQDVREAESVSAWVEQQNSLTFGYLGKLPGRESIRARLEALWNYEKYTTVRKTGGRYFFQKNDGL